MASPTTTATELGGCGRSGCGAVWSGAAQDAVIAGHATQRHVAARRTVARQDGPVEGYRPSSYGDAFADVYDEWYADISPVADTVAFIAGRTGGIVVEVGSGTGRLAGPLRDAGLRVVGIDASVAMLTRSRTAWPEVPVARADMVSLPMARGTVGTVLLAFNTLFNLPSPDLQQRGLAEAAATVGPDGLVVVETFVPGDGADERSDRVEVARLDVSSVVLRVSRNDPDARTVSGHHIELRDGEPVRLRPWHLHYADPAALDRLAEGAGLQLRARFGDWRGRAFDAASPSAVSVFERA